MPNSLEIQQPLSADRQVIKINNDSTGLLLKDNRVFVEEQPTEENEVATKKYVDTNDFAGKIIGYTRLQGDLTNQNSYEIQNSLTVEDATHKVAFKTPSTVRSGPPAVIPRRPAIVELIDSFRSPNFWVKSSKLSDSDNKETKILSSLVILFFIFSSMIWFLISDEIISRKLCSVSIISAFLQCSK